MRAAYLQFLPNDRLNSLRSRQFQKNIVLPSRRGAIVDRYGREMAMSTTAYSLYADPKLLTNKKVLAKKLSKLLNQPSAVIFNKIKDKDRRFVWIQRMMEQEQADVVKSWEIRGLQFVEEWKRVYPNETLLSQTLGFLGSEGQGLEGLELGYNQILTGNQKKFIVKSDARGRPLLNDGLLFTENPEGNELHLTIDFDLQYRLETELAHAISEFEAEQAYGVILDAKTSAVLAMASLPSFNSNQIAKVSPEMRRNRVMTDAFEPGSTLKTFVIAAGLRDGVLQPNSKFYCEKGSFRVGKHLIKEAESKEKFEDLTVAEILAFSSNVGTTKIAFKMGSERVRQGLLDFGFGQKSGIDFPGEARGLVHKLPWRQHLLSNISFGHGIATTPLQIANAYAAIANGGVLNTPYVVRGIRDSETGVLSEMPVRTVRRVLTPEQASQMRAMLVGVTTEGSGANARVDGYMVGGKTGTAQKVNPNGRGYSPGQYISSFAGFIPANEPQFVIYVAVDSPQKKNYYGATVAAPVFSRIASFAVRKEGIAPLRLAEKKGVEKSLSAKAELAKVNEKSLEAADGIVPNLLKLSTREVLRRLSGQDIKVIFVGQGLVDSTIPQPGSTLPADKEIKVILK